MAKAKKVGREVRNFHITCEGMVPFMFDRYIDNGPHEPYEKIYPNPDGNGALILPAENVRAFLGAWKKSCAAVLEGVKVKRQFCDAVDSFIIITPEAIAFTRNGKPLTVGKFDKEQDGWGKDCALRVHTVKAVAPAGPPHIVSRPVLDLPWEVAFDIMLAKNDLITPERLTRWIVEGGWSVAMGAWRPRYGRFRGTVKEVD